MAREGRPGPGDLTGLQKARDAKAQAAADQDEHAEASFRRRENLVAEESGVFDPQSGERLDGLDGDDGGNIFDTLGRPEVDSFAPVRRAGLFEEEEILTGKESEEDIAPILERRKVFTTTPETVHADEVTIRVDMDVEKMTYGMLNGEPNNFNFREGMAYKVPYAVYEHLNERGLIRQRIR